MVYVRDSLPCQVSTQFSWRGGEVMIHWFSPQPCHSSHPNELSTSRGELECCVSHMLLIQAYLCCQGQELWSMEAGAARGAEAGENGIWRPVYIFCIVLSLIILETGFYRCLYTSSTDRHLVRSSINYLLISMGHRRFKGSGGIFLHL